MYVNSFPQSHAERVHKMRHYIKKLCDCSFPFTERLYQPVNHRSQQPDRYVHNSVVFETRTGSTSALTRIEAVSRSCEWAKKKHVIIHVDSEETGCELSMAFLRL